MNSGDIGGSAQDLQQTPISITKPEGKTVLINCHVSSHDFSNVFIHWYQKRVNAVPKRIAYMFSRFFLENQSDEGKFTVEKDPRKSVCTLTVSKVTLQDSATYYCASWDAQQPVQKAALNISLVPNSRSFSPHAISLLSLPGVDMQSVPVQTPAMQKQMKGMSASMSCKLRGKNIVHWYRQLPGQPPKRILYDSGGTAVFEDSNDGKRFQVWNDPAQSIYDLKIAYLTQRDSGIYYCAYWYQEALH
ncbi:unnamed protein product [Coccothraustes coccothraustes]